MSNEINYKNNPLHGVSLKGLLIEIVDQYGFEILFAYLISIVLRPIQVLIPVLSF